MSGGFAGLSGPAVLVSWDNLSTRLWTNRQHTAAQLARHHPVLFVETSRFVVADVMERLRRGRSVPVDVPGVEVLSARNVAPYGKKSDLASRINMAVLRRRVRRRLNNGGAPDIAWVYDVFAWRLVEQLDAVLRVYHCVDDYSGYVTDLRRRHALQRAERRLLERVDVVFTTSEPLARRLRPYHREVHAFTNVVDAKHFAHAVRLRRRAPSRARRAVFVGSITGRKVDLAALTRVASTRGWTMDIAGPITDLSSNDRIAWNRLLNHDAVTYHGVIQYADLPAFLAGMDVGIAPGVRNDYTRGVFPMKVFEYVAAGLPVVVTGFDAVEASGLGADVPVYSGDAAEIGDLLEAAYLDPRTRDERSAVAAPYTWEARLEAMSQIAADVIDSRQGGQR